MGLWEFRGTPVHTLSWGEVQKLALAGVLAHGASHLPLDEPTSMLSPWERDAVQLTLADLRSEGVGVLQVAHQPEEVLWADQVVALAEGRIAFNGAPERYFASGICPWEAPPVLVLRRRVDPEGAARLWSEVRGYQSETVAGVVVATHWADSLLGAADGVLCLERGEVSFAGSAAGLEERAKVSPILRGLLPFFERLRLAVLGEAGGDVAAEPWVFAARRILAEPPH